jgi:hypothetical protein
VATEASLDANCELAALYESQSMRLANRKALKPQPTGQAKLVAWHLIYRVPLHWAAILTRKLPKRANASTCRSKLGRGRNDHEWRRLVAVRKNVRSAFVRLIRDAHPQQSKQKHRRKD